MSRALLGLAGVLFAASLAITCSSRKEVPPLAPRPEPTAPGAPAPGDNTDRVDASVAPMSSAAPTVPGTPATAQGAGAQIDPPIPPDDSPIPNDAGSDTPDLPDAPPPMPLPDAGIPPSEPEIKLDAGFIR